MRAIPCSSATSCGANPSLLCPSGQLGCILGSIKLKYLLEENRIRFTSLTLSNKCQGNLVTLVAMRYGRITHHLLCHPTFNPCVRSVSASPVGPFTLVDAWAPDGHEARAFALSVTLRVRAERDGHHGSHASIRLPSSHSLSPCRRWAIVLCGKTRAPRELRTSCCQCIHRPTTSAKARPGANRVGGLGHGWVGNVRWGRDLRGEIPRLGYGVWS